MKPTAGARGPATRTALIRSSLVMLLAGAACAPSPGRAGAALHSQLNDDWTYWMAQYPETATSVGYPGQNARWTDYSAAAISGRAVSLKRRLERLGSIDRTQLDAADQLNFDLYRDLLQSAVQGLDFQNDAMPIRGVIPHNLAMPVNQLEGVQQDIPRTLAAMPAATRTDYDDIVARLSGVAQLVDQTIALMERGLGSGATPPKITMRDVPDQVRALIAASPLDSPLLAAFTTWPPSMGAADRTALTARASAAYRSSVVPALERLHGFLISRYVPACRDSTSAAVLPNGAAMYAYNVKWHTTTDQTPQEIHALGLAEVKRIRAEMAKVVTASGFTGSEVEFAAFLRTNPQFYFTDAAALLAGYRDIAKRADPELAHLFGRLPQTPYGVKAVPAAIAPSQTTAYYEPGSVAAGRAANMFANTFKLDSRPKWEMETLTMHEAVPGHHVQISIAQELQGLPEFRKNSSYTAFVEGWGLYGESLGAEMGFYRDPYSKFGQLTYEMWRAVRLVVDTGLHSMGWTRDQAVDFFRTNAAKTDQDIIVEVDRYIVWPGQALGYKIGQLTIRNLRSRAERTLGARFDVRAFHDVVLGQGAVPLDVLERQVGAWVARAQSAP